MTPQSPSKPAPWDLTQVSQSPSAAPSYFPQFHWWSEISPLSKVILVLGKARRPKDQIWAVGGCHLGDLMFHQKLCTRRAWSWWSCQSPVALSYSFLNHPNSFHGGMFKLNTKFNADLLVYWLSRFECGGHTVQMLTQWCLPPLLTRIVKSSWFTHVHSSPLSSAAKLHWCCSNSSFYINNGWTAIYTYT